MKGISISLFTLVLVLSFSLITAVPAAAVGTPLSGYGVAISSPQTPGDGGWADVSVPAGKVVLGGGFSADAPVAASAPGTPGWRVQDAPGGVSNTIVVYAIYADAPAGYGVATSSPQTPGDGGWADMSVPAGKVVLGGGFYATAPVAASAPGTPGWVVRDAPDGVSNTIVVYAIYADEPAGYGVVTSSDLNYSDGGWGGWSVPEGRVVLGGGFDLTGGPAAVSAPGTPNSDWPHWTYGPAEYGWVVRDAPDGNSSPNSKVYAIYADEPADEPPDGGGGCFIATAAYGSYLDSHVETLRDFRDSYIVTNPVGSALVSVYYDISPPIADFIDDHPALKPIVRAGLLPAVAMSTVAVNTTWAQKIAIIGSLALVSALTVVWLRRRAFGRKP